MSYRQHLVVLNKAQSDKARTLPASHFQHRTPQREDYPELSDLEFSEIECEFDEFQDSATAFYELIKTEYGCSEDYCIGRLNIPGDIGAPFYLDTNTQCLFDYYKPRVLTAKDFEQVIDIMREFIHSYYKTLLADETPDVKKILSWKKMIADKVDTWEAPYVKPYNLNTNQPNMVNAFDAEYQIWDMIRVYRSVDWDTQLVVFFGW